MVTNNQPLIRPARPVTPSGIVASELERLQSLARQLGYVDQGFLRSLDDIVALSSGLESYVTACSTPESADLAELARATRTEDWADRFADGGTTIPLEQEMLSGHLEGQMLKILVRSTGARRVLEIGLFTGYSALAMAEALPDDGILVACEIDPFAAEFARRAFERSSHGRKIRIEIDPAIETLDRLAGAGERFDFVFIDADKSGYWAYLDKLLSADLLTAGALVCVDNTLMQGQPYLAGEPTDNGRAIADFNRLVAEDPRVEQVLLPVRDGVTLIRQV
jgi:caffeoyl-CoA O-methyltransferase